MKMQPRIAVDIIIKLGAGIVLIKRKNPPYGWALPGGFVEYGETVENAAVREAKEETDLDIKIIRQLHTYSGPKRDPRWHTISTAFISEGKGTPKAKDDAAEIAVFKGNEIPKLAFDHNKIIDDFYGKKY